MAITLGDIVLPQGLLWEDEFGWSPVAQSTDYGLDGSLIIQEAEKLAGRPITLLGGRQWAWLSRADLLALTDLLAPVDAVISLTLHDDRSFSVAPRRDGDGPVVASPLPVVRDRGPANPTDASLYWLERLRLLEVPAP